MSRNFYNLLGVFCILIFFTACFCQSDRDNKPFFDSKRSDTDTTTPNSSDKQPKNFDDTSEFSENKDEDKDIGDFVVDHVKVKNPIYKEVDEKIKADKTLEKAAVKLNSALMLPRNITLRTKDCGEINANYDPNDASVTVCYELMEYFYKLFRANGKREKEANKQMFDAVQFVFLHEIGHALIDIYELPVTGNEEDAADRCSSYINLEELGEDGVDSVLAAADAFRFESRGKTPSKRNLADEHLLHEQRFYNSLCMIYGSNTKKYADLVGNEYLPEQRASRCGSEYKRMVESWERLLEPWRKN